MTTRSRSRRNPTPTLTPVLSESQALRVYQDYAKSVEAILAGGELSDGTLDRSGVGNLQYSQSVLHYCLNYGYPDFNAAWAHMLNV